MRRLVYLLSFLSFTQLSYGYSCLPPQIGEADNCRVGYFTLPTVEDTIHSIKNLTNEGKRFIYSKILNKENNLKILIDLKTFPEEICSESELYNLNIFKDGSCLADSLRVSLLPISIFDKARGRVFGEGNINTDGTGGIKVGFDVSWDF